MSNVILMPVVQRSYRMSFGAALSALKQGYKLNRGAWKPTGIYLIIEERIEGDLIQLVTPYGLIDWEPKQQDILAQDWVIIEEEYR